MAKGQRASLIVGTLLLFSALLPVDRAEAHHVRLTATQKQLRDLNSSVVRVSAHRAIEAYLRVQYLHRPHYAPAPLSPRPIAEAVVIEKRVPQASVSFRFPLPTKAGNGGRLDFAAKYSDPKGNCFWEVHEIKPAGWHYNGSGQAALGQLYSYIGGIQRDKHGEFDSCLGRPATRWKEGQPGWHTIPPKYTGLYKAYNVKLQVQTWYSRDPGIVYYRFVWKDRDKRQQALLAGVSRHLAELVNRIARGEFTLSNRFVVGELVPWMWGIWNEA